MIRLEGSCSLSRTYHGCMNTNTEEVVRLELTNPSRFLCERPCLRARDISHTQLCAFSTYCGLLMGTHRLVCDGPRLWPPVEDCLDWSIDKIHPGFSGSGHVWGPLIRHMPSSVPSVPIVLFRTHGLVCDGPRPCPCGGLLGLVYRLDSLTVPNNFFFSFFPFLSVFGGNVCLYSVKLIKKKKVRGDRFWKGTFSFPPALPFFGVKGLTDGLGRCFVSPGIAGPAHCPGLASSEELFINMLGSTFAELGIKNCLFWI